MDRSPLDGVLIPIGICLEMLALFIGLSGFWTQGAPLSGVLVHASRPTFYPPTATPLPAPTHLPTAIPTATPAADGTPEPTLISLPTPTTDPASLPDSVEVPILTYHYVEELPVDADATRQMLTVLPDHFEAQLQYLSAAGYHPITLADLYHDLTEGQPLPDKPIILTFDDGYRDAYDIVFPLLQKYGFVGTFFILSGPVGNEDPTYLAWAMIEEMAGAGMDIEGHGRDHFSLTAESPESQVYQIQGVKEDVESHTGKPVHFFCYPYGEYDENVIAAVQAAGYWGAVSTEWGRFQSQEILFTLHRIRIHGSDGLQGFIEKVEGE